MTNEKKDKGSGDVYFFSGVDRRVDQNGDLNPDGKILSEYPAWYFDNQIEDLQEEISTCQKNISRYRKDRIFDEESIYKQNRDLELKKKKLELIESSKPKLNGAQKDKLWEVAQNLTKEVRGLLFTKSEMKLGTPSPHEEASRIIDKKISVDKLGISPQMAKDLNLNLKEGRASRGDLERALKIVNKLFGEDTNLEHLRADRITVRR